MTRDPRGGTPAPEGTRPEGEPHGAVGADPRGDAPAGRAARPAAPRRQAKSPDHRPPWLVLLSSLTLIYGGVLLVSSLDTLRDPRAATHLPATQAMTPAEDEIARQILDVGVQVTSAHARSLRGNAAVSLLVALLMLFAAAATISRDRRGRQVALAAAWTGILYQLGTVAQTYPIVRDYARQVAPLLERLVVLQGNGADANATPEVVAKVVVAFPVFTAAVAIAGSLVLIRFFGGRRGRILYGLETKGQ